MTDILLLGILIMQIITFHYNSISSGRYMKYYDAVTHRLTKYLRREVVSLSVKAAKQSKKQIKILGEKIKERRDD